MCLAMLVLTMPPFETINAKPVNGRSGKILMQRADLGRGLSPPMNSPPGATGLHIESRLNGKVMQSASTQDMVFAVAQTVSLMSQCMTLEPGDVILMGTPAGVGYARTPPVWMRPGDVIEIEIEGIGTLRNTIAEA